MTMQPQTEPQGGQPQGAPQSGQGQSSGQAGHDELMQRCEELKEAVRVQFERLGKS